MDLHALSRKSYRTTERFSTRDQLAGDLGSPEREVVSQVELDTTHLADEICEHTRPAADTIAKDQLRRTAEVNFLGTPINPQMISSNMEADMDRAPGR
jgi:hypothetical protein